VIEGAHGPVDRGPVKRGEAGTDADGAAAEVAAGGGEDRRGGVVFEDQVFEAKKVFPRGGESGEGAVEGDATIEHADRGTAGAGFEAPCAVAGGFVFEERPAADGGFEVTFWILAERSAGDELRAEGGPIEAEVGTDAGILRDAEIVAEEEIVDSAQRTESLGEGPTEYTEGGHGVARGGVGILPSGLCVPWAEGTARGLNQMVIAW